jgi:glyoxylase-like metal-dependent hydrolase (beta-lactamase superfamily II)
VPAGAPLGRVVAGYWRVSEITPGTWAIGEPADAPDNYEYLLVGTTRALLIDAGATARDLRPVLRELTSLPVTAIPTHLHFDHTNGLRHFDSVALVDVPETRARLQDGRIHLSRYQVLASPDGTEPARFPVTEWVPPEGWIDLGGRRVQVISTPGHTATSVSIHDPASRQIFTGDFLYTTTLYAFMVDSSLADYQATLRRLLERLPEGTTLYGAHCCRSDGPPGPPWLNLQDARDAERAVAAIRAGDVRGEGLLLRRFPVNAQMTMLTLYPFGNR